LYKKILLTLILVFGIQVNIANAATISIIPDNTSVSVGSIFNANVYVSANGTSINNAEGSISFPPDLLQVISVSNSSSIFNIWLEQPSYSNSTGQISFNGGVPNPGFSSNMGNALRVQFRAIKAGTAPISFSSALIRANDGLGTDVTSGKTGTTVNIITSAVNPAVNSTANPTASPTISPVTKTVTEEIPDAPVISSKTAPDEDSWYAIPNVTFTWPSAKNITGTGILVDSYADSIPQTSYTKLITSKTINDLRDGTWYIHVRLRNGSGWSKTSHRKIKVDNTAPENINATSSLTTDDLVQLSISGKDSTSGIQTYKIYLDGASSSLAEISPTDDLGNAIYVLSVLNPGPHQVIIEAYDYAGNHSAESISIQAPDLKTPKILTYKPQVVKGERIEITGNAYYPKTDVVLTVEEGGGIAQTFTVTTDANGMFDFAGNYTKDTGVITISAQTVRGTSVELKSLPSEKINILVNKTPFAIFSDNTVEILKVAIPAVSLFLGMLLIIFYAFYKMRKLKKVLKKDFAQAESDVHETFKTMKDDNKSIVKMLTKASTLRKLTKEESAILENLNQNVEAAEKYFTNKIKKIQKDDLK
jgi:hypothetical protein